MRRNGHKTTSGQIFKPKFEIPMGCFLFKYEYWQRFRQDLYVLFAKNCFHNAKFSEFGRYWGWGWKFLTKPPKGTFCLISCILSHRWCTSVHGFLLQACAQKKGHDKKSDRSFTYSRGIPHPTKFNRKWHTSRGRRRNQSHKSLIIIGPGVQSYVGSNFASLHRNGLSLYI